MRILVTGGGGQLADALDASCGRDPHHSALHELRSFGREELDVTSEASVVAAMKDHSPDLVINAAAYTAVDKAESEADEAMAVNGFAVGVLARACRSTGARLVHVSTDFVFPGNGSTPLQPRDPTGPLSVYGKSKLAGETECLETLGADATIVRTAWVYSAGHRNFVSTMLRLMRQRSEIPVVADQIGTPTWAVTLAAGILKIVDSDARGVFHLTDSGVASWYDFAVAIEAIGRGCGLLDRSCDVLPIRSVDYPTPARRPAYGVLECSGTTEVLGRTPPHWMESLRQCLSSWKSFGEEE